MCSIFLYILTVLVYIEIIIAATKIIKLIRNNILFLLVTEREYKTIGVDMLKKKKKRENFKKKKKTRLSLKGSNSNTIFHLQLESTITTQIPFGILYFFILELVYMDISIYIYIYYHKQITREEKINKALY